MSEQKEKHAQMTFDFGFAEESAQEPEVVDIGDAEDSLGLPPDGIPEGGSLSFSVPEEESFADTGEIPAEEELSEEELSGEELSGEPESMFEEEDIEIISSDEEFISSDIEKEMRELPEKEPEKEQGAEYIPVRKKALAFDAKNVKRSALAFLASLGADAVAPDVPLRYRKYVIDAAGFWCSAEKNRIRIDRTAGVEVVWKDSGLFAEKSKWIRLLAETKEELERVKEKIRENEPHLCICDTLFCDEFKWEYSRTEDPAYKDLQKKICELENKLFHGTIFDRLRKMGAVSEFYLAVPEGLISSENIPEEWGLVSIRKDLSFHLEKAAIPLVSSKENMHFLAVNIARSSVQNVLFANGIEKTADECKVIRLPRKRRN